MDSILLFITMVVIAMLVAIPALVFEKTGLDPYEMSIIPFLLFWIFAVGMIYFGIKMIVRMIRSRSKKPVSKVKRK